MITFEQAKQIVEELLKLWSKEEMKLVILEDSIKEEEFGWIFPFTSQEYIKSKNKLDMPLGSLPVIIDKNDGKMYQLSFDDFTKLVKKTHSLKEILRKKNKILSS